MATLSSNLDEEAPVNNQNENGTSEMITEFGTDKASMIPGDAWPQETVYKKQMICKKGKLYAADMSELKDKPIDNKTRPLIDLTNLSKDNDEENEKTVDLTPIASTKAVNNVDRRKETISINNAVHDLSKDDAKVPIVIDLDGADEGAAEETPMRAIDEKVDGTCVSAKLRLKRRRKNGRANTHLPKKFRRRAPAFNACYGCGWCKFRARYSQTVLRHHFIKHARREPDIVCLRKPPVPESELKPSIGFSCHNCDFSGRFRRELNVHQTKLHRNRDSPGGITDSDWDSQANPVYPHIYYNPSRPHNFDELRDKYKLRDAVVQFCDVFQMGTDYLRDLLIKHNIRKACVDILREEEFVSMAYRHKDGVFLQGLVKSPELIGKKSEKQIAALVKTKPKHSRHKGYLKLVD